MKPPFGNNQDATVIEYLDRLGRRSRAHHYAVHIRLSESYFYRRNRAFVTIAGHTVLALAQRYNGQMFTLWNEDILLVIAAEGDHELSQIAKQIQYLFTEDPMAFESGVGTDYEKLCTWYGLFKEFAAFRDAVEAVLAAGNKGPTGEARRSGRRLGKGKSDLAPLTSAEVAAIENALRQSDISVFLKRQPIAVVLSDQKPETIFHEMHVSINALKQRLFPTVDLRGGRWLFQALTVMLDDRMLAYLRRDRTHSRFSVNLNVATVLSDKFIAFDESIKSGSRGSIVIEFQRADVLYDFGAFRMARDFLRGRGYRVCIDGITPDVLAVFSHPELEVDFMKLFYFKDQEVDWTSDRLKAQIKAANRLRLIMARVDDEAALSLGKALGIRLFQGFFVDRLISAYEPRIPSTGVLKTAMAPRRAPDAPSERKTKNGGSRSLGRAER
ncbi:MAG: EAL domain-containing protein [Alphaproteobacteria bacterium]|nr:EAL domain-containing protein [Alphaproteobacteria bacterium]